MTGNNPYTTSRPAYDQALFDAHNARIERAREAYYTNPFTDGRRSPRTRRPCGNNCGRTTKAVDGICRPCRKEGQ